MACCNKWMFMRHCLQFLIYTVKILNEIAGMKKIAVIPARYASTRFPAKLMQLLSDKTIIRNTYENTIATGLFDKVLVVTDSEIIFNEMQDGNVVMSKGVHESGSDRIAEAIANTAYDIIVNVQGDEPFVD